MPLTVPHIVSEGHVLDATEFNENFDAVEAKFRGAIVESDLKAKWFRFCLAAGEMNADGLGGAGSIPNMDSGIWWETQLPFTFIVDKWTLAVQEMLNADETFGVVVEYSINNGAAWQNVDTATFTWEGAAGVVGGVPGNPRIPSLARLRLRLTGTFWSLRSPSFTIWGKALLGEV